MSNRPEEYFVLLCRVLARGQGRSKASLVPGEAAFGLGSSPILLVGESIVHHPAISPGRRLGRVAAIDGNDRTANPQLHSAQRMVVFRIIAPVGKDPSRTQDGRGLLHRRNKIGRILTETLTGHRTDNQLRSRMKDGRQLRPGCVPRCWILPESPLEMNQCMPRFQACGVDCRSVRVIVEDQATSAS